VLRVIEKSDPEPAAGEVRVKLAFSGVNPSDVKSRAGVSARGSGYPEVIPHSDGAGTIDKIGQGVNSALLGQRVWVFNGQWDRPFGTAAEFITLPVAQTVALPNNLSFEIGACPSSTVSRTTNAVLVEACEERVRIHSR
jgi:NADPH2:quinone reductase